MAGADKQEDQHKQGEEKTTENLLAREFH